MAHLTDTFTYDSLYLIKHTRLGSPSNPPVIFVHGTPFSSHVWLPFARALQERYYVHLYDLPGYGESQELTPGDGPEHEDPDVSYKLQGRALAALCGHWGFSDSYRPHVIAHDIGGCAAMRAHLLEGVRYVSICLLDVVVIRPWGSPFLRLVRDTPRVFDQVPLYAFEALLRAYINGASYKGLRKDIEDKLTASWMDRGEEGKKAFVRQIAHAEEKDTVEMEPLLKNTVAEQEGIEKKVKVIWAEKDTWIPVDVGDRLKDEVGAAEYVRVPDAGHLIMIDQPEKIMYELVTWLAKVA